MVRILSEKERDRRTLKVLEALLLGLRIPYRRWTICLTQDYRIATVSKTEDGDELFLFTGGETVQTLRQFAEGLTDEQYQVMLANIALNKV